MADTAEMLRLMRHAADLLDACNPTINSDVVDRISSVRGTTTEARSRALQEVVAMETAKTVLRMVAACMADEAVPP